MDILPQHVLGILMEVSRSHIFTSFRVYGEESITVSLKFNRHGDNTGNDSDHYVPTNTDSTLKSRQFRSKPPSGIVRDHKRQSEWQNNKSNNNTSNGGGDPAMFYTTSYSNTSPFFNINSIQDSGIDATHNGLSSTLLETSPTDKCMPQQTSHNVTTRDVAVTCDNFSLETETQTCSETMNVNIALQTMAPHTSANACQTVPPVSRKTQSLNFNNCTRRIQTLPISLCNVSTQSEYIHTTSTDTMTCRVQVNEAACNTQTAVQRLLRH